MNYQVSFDKKADEAQRAAITALIAAQAKPSSLSLATAWLMTPLGSMLAIADEHQLYFLEFADTRAIEKTLAKLMGKATLVWKHTPIIDSIEQELGSYFEGKLKQFKTPVKTLGTTFQQRVWAELQKIPYGQTRSYLDMAEALNQPLAIRAAATANGANPLAIVIPCHRVINRNGKLGGYAAGLDRKEWLLKLEGHE